MTPDTLVIDRAFKGVGRIRRATGTTNPAIRRRIGKMLTDLQDSGRVDILRAIRDGHLTFLETLDAYTRRSLDSLPTGPAAKPAADAFAAWRDGLRVPDDYSADHIRTMATTITHLRAARAGALVADLPDVLEKLRSTLGKRAPRSFNLTRSHVMAFVRATLKKSHPVWMACSAVEPRRVKPTKAKNPLTPVQMRGWFPKPETDPVDAIAWTMATTGMNAKEMWGTWDVRADRIHVVGTKREGRVRDVPLVLPPVVPTLRRRLWEDAIRERAPKQLVPYDLRRTYSNWMESAGIPRTRRRLYMGHGAKDVTDLYEAHEVTAFLSEDAGKLRKWLGMPEGPALVKLRMAK